MLSLTHDEVQTRDHLREYVRVLAQTIGGRSAVRYQNLCKAADYIAEQLHALGYAPARQNYEADHQTFTNVETELGGNRKAGSVLVVGAHYDTAAGLPGANDNASGVAAVLELARQFAGKPQVLGVRWVFFANEEPPYFQTPAMGSYVYAGRCRERKEEIAAMLSLETIGYYSEKPGSQTYPIGLHPGYPDRGNFLGFVADLRSAFLLQRALKAFRRGNFASGAGRSCTFPYSGCWLVRSLVLLAIRLPRAHGHRYSAVSLSLLSHDGGHAG